MKTREANKDAHPGQADVPKSRRSAAEMELVRAVEAEQNAAEKRQRLVLIQKVADMEDQLQHEDRNRSQEAYTGPPTVSKSTEAPKDPGELLGHLYWSCTDALQTLVHQTVLPPKKHPLP